MPQWNRVASFGDVESDFFDRAHRMVWCNVATVDTRDRLTSRLRHLGASRGRHERTHRLDRDLPQPNGTRRTWLR